MKKECEMADGATVVVGGTRGIGLEIARHFAASGQPVVLTGQTPANVEEAVATVGGHTTGVTFDLAQPKNIAPALADVGPVRHLVLVAIDRDQNTVREFDVERATRLAVLKLVGYTEVVHTLLDRLDESSAIVLFGGQAKDLPYPGSTTVSTVNGGIEGLTRSLVHELKPIRVNCIHPGIVGDSPYWKTRQAALDATRTRTPTGRLVTMAEIVSAVDFLLTNEAMNGVYLKVDGGIHAT
jgi:NAD(P)-dependent dehydrogenase (short-subunit alcohol dehydrogenase family)